MQFLHPQNTYSYKDEVMAYLPREHRETSGWEEIIYPSKDYCSKRKLRLVRKNSTA